MAGRERARLEERRAKAVKQQADCEAASLQWSAKYSKFVTEHASQEELQDRIDASSTAIVEVKPALTDERKKKKKLRADLWTAADHKLYVSQDLTN